MTENDRACLAQILALPSGPWEPYPGYKTCAEYAEQMEVFRRHNDAVFKRDKKAEPKGRKP